MELSVAGAIVAATLVMLAGFSGCIGQTLDARPEELPARRFLDATKCDAPLLDERIRMREVDLATNPNNPDQLAAGLIVSLPTMRGRAPHDWPFWIGFARSDDGGLTWRLRVEPGWPGDPTPSAPFSGSVFLSDPIVLFLSDGTLLFSGFAVRDGVELFVERYPPGSLTPESTSLVAQGAITTTAGLHQLVGTPFPTIYNDKQQLAQDPFTGDVFISWMWRTTGAESDRAMPVTARSTDGGRNWGPPLSMYDDGHFDDPDGGFHVGAWPFVTEDGVLHVIWWDATGKQLVQVDSADHGETFTKPRAIQDDPTTFGEPDGVIQLGIPSIDVDRSGGPFHGSVYVTWEDRRNGDRDVFLAYSRDNASTWSAPVRVSSDEVGSGKDQFFPQLVVDGAGGVDLILMDRQNDAENVEFLAYVARSLDGGVTFANYPVASAPSRVSTIRNSGDADQPDPLGRTRLGDYVGIAYNKTAVLALWQDGRDGTPSVPYSTAYLCRAEVEPKPWREAVAESTQGSTGFSAQGYGKD